MTCRFSLYAFSALILISFLFSPGRVHAQKKNIIEGSVGAPRENEEGYMSVIGAVVLLITPSDTIYTVSGTSGDFILKTSYTGKALLKVEHLSYNDYYKKIDIGQGSEQSLLILLEEKKENISASKVTGKTPVLEFIGDTLKYNVAATQRISEDDMLGDVLMRLPGVVLQDGRLMVMGEGISKIYIDGRLLFGDNPEDPVVYLSAKEVVNLKVYEQLNKRIQPGLAGSAPTERVINVQTRNKLRFVAVAHASVGAGGNMKSNNDETDLRYLGGAASNYFSEKTLYSLNAYLNNVGKTNEYNSRTILGEIPKAYSRRGYAGGRFIKKWNDPEFGESLSVSYSYSNEKKFSRSSRETEYISDKLSSSHFYTSKSKEESQTGFHNAGLVFTPSVFSKIPTVSISAGLEGNEANRDASHSDILGKVESTASNMSADRARAVFLNFSLSKLAMPLMPHLSLTYNITGSFRNSSGKEEYINNINGLLKTPLLAEPFRRDVSLSVSPSLSYHFNKAKGYLQLEYSFEYDKSTVDRKRYLGSIAPGNLNPLISNSQAYDYIKNKTKLSFKFNNYRLSYNVGAVVCLASHNSDVSLPYSNKNNKRYLDVFPSISLSYYKGLRFKTYLSIYGNAGYPSNEQLSSYIDDNNPLFILKGDPSLRQSRGYRSSFSVHNMIFSKISMSSEIQAGLVCDDIVVDRSYYASGALIDGYNIPAGATLHTYRNMNGGFNAGARNSYSFYIRPVKSSLNLALSYGFLRKPSMLDGHAYMLDSHSAEINFRAETNYSERFSQRIYARPMYNWKSSSLFESYKSTGLMIKLASHNMLTKNLFIDADYSYFFESSLSGASFSISKHRVDLVAGYRFLGRRCELNLSLYDLLNNLPAFSVSIQENSRATTFTPNLGRIYLISFVYRFNSSQGQRGASKKIDFGMGAPEIGRDYEKKSDYNVSR